MNIKYDPFQEEAIKHIDAEHSVIVAAPTGAGKTVIAEYAIEKAVARNENAIYTAPIKALSNQKYRDFRQRFGDERVGIVTGDVAINPYAEILIMTTEIYRNTLFENPARLGKVAWVVFDEVHYIDDYERGTVWEEAIMFSPPHIRLLCLSATVPNLEELAEWIRNVHGRSIQTVVETHRPVPLTHYYQCQGQIMHKKDDLKKKGYLGMPVWKLSWRARRRGHRLPKVKPNRTDNLIRHLESRDLFPCIYFSFGRRRTEYLAWELTEFNFLAEDERAKVTKLFNDLCEKYNLEDDATAKKIFKLVKHGIAYHHAGMLPTLKEVIEQLFTSRLIKLIFTTETFALGINMPARSVILDELRKFFGTHFGNLRTRDFYQMAGRAGRRGMDKEGFVFIRIHPNDISFNEVMEIIYGGQEKVVSQFNTGYATILNLYGQLGENLIQVYPRSLHYYQSQKKKRERGYETIERRLRILKDMDYIERGAITEKGKFASTMYGYELPLAEMHGGGFLEHLTELELNQLLSALVFEPRKGEPKPKLPKRLTTLINTAESYSRHIYQKEKKFGVRPYTKRLHFNLAPAIEAWCAGDSFDKITSIAFSDEGEIVRYFRMTIQLLRQLMHSPHASEELRQKAAKARNLMNRDVIDAEKQLRA